MMGCYLESFPLPTELLIKVFDDFSKKELGRLRLVCKEWDIVISTMIKRYLPRKNMGKIAQAIPRLVDRVKKIHRKREITHLTCFNGKIAYRVRSIDLIAKTFSTVYLIDLLEERKKIYSSCQKNEQGYFLHLTEEHLVISENLESIGQKGWSLKMYSFRENRLNQRLLQKDYAFHYAVDSAQELAAVEIRRRIPTKKLLLFSTVTNQKLSKIKVDHSQGFTICIDIDFTPYSLIGAFLILKHKQEEYTYLINSYCLETGKLTGTQIISSPISQITSNDQMIVVACTNGKIFILDPEIMKIRKIIYIGTNEGWSIEWKKICIKANKLICLFSSLFNKDNIFLINLKNYKIEHILSSCFVCEQNYLFTYNIYSHSIDIRDLELDRFIYRIETTHEVHSLSVDLSSHRPCLAAVLEDGTIQIWSPVKGAKKTNPIIQACHQLKGRLFFRKN